MEANKIEKFIKQFQETEEGDDKIFDDVIEGNN